MATIAAACALAGCSFSTSVSGEAGDGGVDVTMIDGPPDDVDGDGVKNETDNCPAVANTGQYDEDTDGRGDECDPCPQLSGAANDADDDGDQIGNGCDPRPAMAGDVLAYWNGFHVASAALPTGLSMIHGSAARWSVTDGALVFAPNNDDWGMPVVDVASPRHTTDATFQIATTFSGTASAAGVAVDVAADDTDLFECQARTDSQAREMWRRNPGALDGWSALESTIANTPNDTYRIVLQRTPTDLACTTTRLGQVSVALTNPTDSLTNTRAGVFARNVEVRFRYLAVYTSP